MKKVLTILLTLVMAATLINLNNSHIKAEENDTDYFCITATDGNPKVSIKLVLDVGSSTVPNLQYKINNGSFTAYSIDSQISLNKGDKLYFKAGADNETFAKFVWDYGPPVVYSTKYYHHFVVADGKVSASGNIMSLLYTDLSSASAKIIPASYCLYALFYDCANIKSIDNLKLPATTLGDYCYTSMFEGCTGLTTLPEDLLPANTLADYCYYYMFYNCTGLTTLPKNLLPAKNLASDCYSYMFKGCTSLTNVPNLPATTLAFECYYYMFDGCTGLTTLPEDLLPANTLAGECYRYMFNNCTGLKTLPQGLLPAKNLADYCYGGMFYGCTSLTNIPNLPATTFVDGCYCSMFEGCTDLYKGLSESQTQELTEQFTIPTSGQTATWVSGCTNDMFNNTGGTLTSAPNFSTAKSYYRRPSPAPAPQEQGDMPYDDTKGFNATIAKGSASTLTAHINNVKKGTDTVVVKNGDTTLTENNEYKIEGGSSNADSIKVVLQSEYLKYLTEDTTLKIIINGTKEFKVTITVNNPSPTPSPSPSKKDESCEKVIGPTWHWNNSKGICEDYGVVGTSTR